MCASFLCLLSNPYLTQQFLSSIRQALRVSRTHSKSLFCVLYAFRLTTTISIRICDVC